MGVKLKSKIKIIFKWIAKIILIIIILALIALAYFNFPVKNENKNAELGVTFSSRYASDIGLDERKTFLAVLDDLKIKEIRLPVYWDLVEKEEGQYNFSEIDWQLEEAAKRNAEIILVVGQKVPRWPECAIPTWAMASDQKRKESLIKFIDVVINRYKNKPVIKYWQVENEPFLIFGICPKIDPSLLDSELALVRKLDSSREIIVSDSGELSLWLQAARRADIFGTTMYRTIYREQTGYFEYPLGPKFFQFKYNMIKFLAGQNKAFVVELQAEPWVAGWTTNAPLEEQFKSMNTNQLRENVSYARRVGFPKIYLWGVEWWYWLATERNHPEIWETAKELFK